MPDGVAIPPVSAAECQALVDRVVASRALSRSSRLRAFLLYVADRSLTYGATNIPEQEIGEAVFNRSPDYDTSLDNIVRVNATELRKRLDQFFLDEGINDELTMTIPRGSYVPVFSRRTMRSKDPDEPALLPDTTQTAPEAPAAEASVTATTAQAKSTTWMRNALIGVSILVLILAGSLVWLLRRSTTIESPWRANAELSRMWSPLFGDHQELDVVIADTSLALARDLSGRQISLDDYVHFRYEGAGDHDALSADSRAALAQVLDRNMVSLGDVHVAQQISRLNPFENGMKILSAREFNSEAVRENSVILIGSRQSNPWVELFKDQLNFSLEYDVSRHQAFVTNRAPRAGEPAVYELPHGGTHAQGYAVVALVPGLSDGGKALIIGGTDAQATQAAGEFVVSPEMLRELFKKMPGDTLLPFEVLLRTTQLTGTPLRSEILAIRISQPKHS